MPTASASQTLAGVSSSATAAVPDYSPGRRVVEMRFNDGNGTTTFPDTGYGGTTWSIGSGSVQNSNTQVLEGVSSLFIPSGGSAYLKAPYVASRNGIPSTGDWSIQFRAQAPTAWLRPDTAGCYIISVQSVASDAPNTVIGLATNSSQFPLLILSDGTTRSVVTGSSILNANQNLLFEIKRAGNTITLTVNGTVMITTTFTGSFPAPTGQEWRIGAPASANSAAANGMYFDSFVIARSDGVLQQTLGSVVQSTNIGVPPDRVLTASQALSAVAQTAAAFWEGMPDADATQTLSAVAQAAASVVTVRIPSALSNSWNAGDISPDFALSPDMRTVTRNSVSSPSYRGVRAARSILPLSGKWYWEIVLTANGGDTPVFSMLGVAGLAQSLSLYVGSNSDAWGYATREGALYNNGIQVIASGTLPTATAGDTIGVAIDADTGNLWFSKNGTWMQSGNPAAGTGQQATITAGLTVYPATSIYRQDAAQRVNFAASTLSYTPPTGFSVYEGILEQGLATVTQSATLAAPAEFLDGIAAMPSAAWSLKKLISTATQAVRVRRSNDNAEQDIGFSGRFFDLAALATFVGSNSAYVTTWYDQTGNGKHQVQATSSKQPRIVNAGVFDGRITADATDDGMQALAVALGTPQVGVYFNGQIPSTGAVRSLIETGTAWDSSAGFGFIVYENGTTFMGSSGTSGGAVRTTFASSSGLPTQKTWLFDRSISGAGEHAMWEAGTSKSMTVSGVNEQTGNYLSTSVSLWARNNAASLFSGASIESVVIYNVDTSAKRAAIEMLVSDRIASGAQTLAGVAQAATATVGAAGTVSAVAAQTLGSVDQAAAAAVIDKASGDQTLGSISQAAAVIVLTPREATAAQLLEQISQAATAQVIAKASGSQALAAVAQTATARALISVAAAQLLAGITQAAAGTVSDTIHQFSAAQLLANITQFARIQRDYEFVRNQRTWVIPAESRAYVVSAEDRASAIGAEDRLSTATAEDRRLSLTGDY